MSVRRQPYRVLLLGLALLLGCRPSDPAPAKRSSADRELTQTEAQAAISRLNAVLVQDPTDASALAARGGLYYEGGVYDRAAADLAASLRLDSSRVEVWHLLADAYLDNLQSRPALNTMIFAASRFPERVPTLLKLAEFQYILQQYDDALATLDRAVKADPNEGEAFFMIGQVLAEQGDKDRAINAYQRATELDASITDAWLSLAALFEERGNPIAERYFNTAVAIDRTAALPVHLKADYLARQGRLRAAVAAYREAIVLDPQYEEAFYNSGLVLLDLDSAEAARQQFERAIRVDPAYADAYLYRGVASELLGDTATARKDYLQALTISPRNEDARAALDALSARQ